MISKTKLNVVILEQNGNSIVALIYKIIVLSIAFRLNSDGPDFDFDGNTYTKFQYSFYHVRSL